MTSNDLACGAELAGISLDSPENRLPPPSAHGDEVPVRGGIIEMRQSRWRATGSHGRKMQPPALNAVTVPTRGGARIRQPGGPDKSGPYGIRPPTGTLGAGTRAPPAKKI